MIEASVNLIVPGTCAEHAVCEGRGTAGTEEEKTRGAETCVALAPHACLGCHDARVWAGGACVCLWGGVRVCRGPHRSDPSQQYGCGFRQLQVPVQRT